MEKWPKIRRFASVVSLIRKEAERKGVSLPTVVYEGTVKLHGTNGSFYVDNDTNELIVQSRNRIITPTSDNNGFAWFIHSHEKAIRQLCKLASVNAGTQAILYGEWCGAGINQGCAIHQAEEKFFVIFGVKQKIDENNAYYQSNMEIRHLKHKEIRIYNITDFDTFSICIDFENPHESKSILIAMTEKVESECPVGRAFGHTGVGEGIVWKPFNSPLGSDYWFKTKGDKHSPTCKVKSVKNLEVDFEQMKTVAEFVQAVATAERLQQGIEYLKEMEKPLDRTSTGEYLRWIIKDVLSEEGERMKVSKLTPADIGKQLSTKARVWYFEQLDKLC